ncbi:MAG: OmpA family protein [candidate division Zixibacteria bacterium]|nr:OmpA family protein [candidate division Zixibacteria bacterium]
MEDEEKQAQPIIVVKKKGGHGGHHGGAWKVAYADFVTAMMAFFLVMWLVSQSDQIKEAVAGYFNDPANYGQMKGQGVLQGSSKPKIPDIKSEKQKELNMLRAAAQNIKQIMEKNPDLVNLRNQVEMTITSRGLKIQLIDKDEEQAFFELGSAKLNPEAKKIISIIGQELAKLDNNIVIEGHTDSRQYTTRKYTNWELSTDRANAARYLLMKNGITKNQIFGIEGYGDRFPKIYEDPMDERNRRVAILVLIKSASNSTAMYEIGSPIY